MDTRKGSNRLYEVLIGPQDKMEKDELDTTLDTLEQEVMDELENPYRPYSVIFPYEVRFTIPDDDHNTEIIINSKTEEFYSGRNPQDVIFQKDLSDRYSKTAFIKHIQKYVRDEILGVEPEDAHFTYTGKPEVREMTESELSTFEREIVEND